MMPSKPPAAKASVFKLPKRLVFNSNLVYDVALTVATEPDFTEDGFYSDFSKMLGFFYGYIVGLEPCWRVHLGFVQTSQAGGELANEMSSTRLQRYAYSFPLIPSYTYLKHQGISLDIPFQASYPCIFQNNFSILTYTGISLYKWNLAGCCFSG